MSRRTRYIWLAVIAVVGTILAIGAWRSSDSDNQGGYVIVFVLLVVLLFIYIPLATRSMAGQGKRKLDSPPGEPE